MKRIIVLLFVLYVNKFFAQSSQTLTVGSGSFTVPCGVTTLTVKCWGGGGGGAGDGTNSTISGGGGGGGGYSTNTISVTPGSLISYTVGGGGTAGSGDANGGLGGTTTFSTVSAPGGAGGLFAGGGGAGGIGNAGTGTSGSAGVNPGGGGAGGAGAFGGGAGGASNGIGNSGLAGVQPGGGGSGGDDEGGGTRSGGAGGAGQIIITWSGANAGPDQSLAACATSATLAANSPSGAGSSGTWSCVSGCTGVTFSNANSPTSTVSGLTPGTNTTLQWTWTGGGAGCTSINDQVVINTLVGPLCPSYCAAPTMNCTVNDGLVAVSFGSTSTTSSPCAAGSAGCQTMLVGQSFTLSATSGTGSGNHSLGAYIDWNSDGDFLDANEFVLVGGNATMGPNQTRTNVFTVPPNATCGATIKFRLIYVYAVTLTSSLGCNNQTYGEVEDYCITISCAAPSCSDGILNQGELAIDCGGPCPACATGSCFDGIMNGTETGIDCGGTCIPCSTNSGTVTSACGACPSASAAVVYSTTCAQVGTSAYNLNSPNVNMVSCGTAVTPVPSPTCATVGSQGTWIHVDLAPGTTQVQLAFNSGSVGSGSSNTYASAYQGPSCASLTPVPGGCQNSVSFISGSYGVYQNFFTNLNPNQDLWIFMFNDAGKAFNLNYNLIGTTTAPSNTTCASASNATGSSCNLGASGASFATPASVGQSCTGGSWGSNENTTFYAFTPTAITATLTVSNILCNSGIAGLAQFGVWTSCAAIGTYSSSSTFLGCVVGTSNLTLTGLTVGQTYYIAADGNSGDNCKWTFTGTNVLLPIELLDFNAFKNYDHIDINWKTASEKNNDYFTVERSLDGINFKPIETIDGAGISSDVLFYETKDMNPNYGLSYYRLKQTDFNKNFTYSDIVSVDFENINGLKFNIVPNPNIENMTSNIVLSAIPNKEITIMITNLQGVNLYEIKKKVDSNIIEIPNSFSKGIYFVKVISSDFTETKRMIIK